MRKTTQTTKMRVKLSRLTRLAGPILDQPKVLKIKRQEPAAPRYPARPRIPPGSWWRLRPETAAAAVLEEPTTHEEAMSSEQAQEWRQAMDDEIKSLLVNLTWTTEPILKGVRAVPVKWVFRVKRDANGNIEQFKARLVAKGFRQRMATRRVDQVSVATCNLRSMD